MYVQVDGHPRAMPVSPITAFETPLVLGGACDSLEDAFLASSCSPLILSAVFTVDFLAIRPFDEGNGRISRLFANLLLERAGFEVFRYMSVDRIIEESGMAYYDALNACVEGWDVSRNDYAPYALYWLETIHEAYRRLFAALEMSGAAGAGKSERVRLFVQRANRPVTKRENSRRARRRIAGGNRAHRHANALWCRASVKMRGVFELCCAGLAALLANAGITQECRLERRHSHRGLISSCGACACEGPQG